MPVSPTCPDRERGSALVAVLGSMAVLSIVLLAGLGTALDAVPAAREGQDSKAAVAAAQAGVEDYLARLNANSEYWAAPDPSNAAFTDHGAPVPGTKRPGAAESDHTDRPRYTYRLLDPAETVGSNGRIRLEVTGRSGPGQACAAVPRTAECVSRTLRATLQPVGFLGYVYYTDIEALDPALYADSHPANVDGANGFTSGSHFHPYLAHGPTVQAMCSRRWYEGRSHITYTATTATPYYSKHPSSGNLTTYANGKTVKLGFDGVGCRNLTWLTGDVVDGPLHTNDALHFTGSVLFKDKATQSSWRDDHVPAPPSPTQRWHGPGTPSSSGFRPVLHPLVELPDSNSKLLSSATSYGCVYTGATRITLADGSMKVLSPNTLSTNKPGCYDTSTPTARSQEQTITPVPPVVYVRGTTGSCSGVGYPQYTNEAAGPTTPDHACTNGNAYVSGRLQGRATIATENDIVITGNVTYRNGTSASDVLGLVADNRVWVYHPVDASGNNLLPAASAPYTIHAAILSVRRSFMVQSWNQGAPVNHDGQKLTVLGSISQRYRGPVATSPSTTWPQGTGYAKNYVYDKRLSNLVPPFFLQPRQAPWVVKQVSG